MNIDMTCSNYLVPLGLVTWHRYFTMTHDATNVWGDIWFLKFCRSFITYIVRSSFERIRLGICYTYFIILSNSTKMFTPQNKMMQYDSIHKCNGIPNWTMSSSKIRLGIPKVGPNLNSLFRWSMSYLYSSRSII